MWAVHALDRADGDVKQIRRVANAYKVYFAKTDLRNGRIRASTISASSWMPLVNMSGSFAGTPPTVWQMLFGRWLKQRTPCDRPLSGLQKAI